MRFSFSKACSSKDEGQKDLRKKAKLLLIFFLFHCTKRKRKLWKTKKERSCLEY
jgi:hypothetical protein